jgi:hypothetical protein
MLAWRELTVFTDNTAIALSNGNNRIHNNIGIISNPCVGFPTNNIGEHYEVFNFNTDQLVLEFPPSYQLPLQQSTTPISRKP